MSDNRVEFTFFAKNSTKDALQEIIRDTKNVGQTAEDTAADLQQRINEQRAVVKQITADIAKMEKQLSSAKDSQTKNVLTAELNSARKVLLEEKGALDELSASVDKSAREHTSLRQQVRNLENEMAGMTEGTEEYRAAMERLGALRDRMGDVSTQGRIFADDNKNIKAATEGITVLTGVMTAGTGVASLFGMEQEKLARIQAKLQAMMAITIGMQQVANALNKDSYFRHVLLAKAKGLLTTANYKLATALGISNAAATALMATLTLGLSVAITAIISGLNALSTAAAKAKEKREAQLKVEVESRKEAEQARLEMMRYTSVLKNFSGTKQEEKRLLDELNQKYGNQFGQFKDLSSAYDTLRGKGEQYIQMLFLQAKAQKLVSEAVELEGKIDKTKGTDASEVDGHMGWFKRWMLYIAQGQSNGNLDATKAIQDYNEENKKKVLSSAEKTKKEIEDKLLKIWGDIENLQKGIYSGGKKTTNSSNPLQDIENATIAARKRINDKAIALMKEGKEKRLATAKEEYRAEMERISVEEKGIVEKLNKAKKDGEKINANHYTIAHSMAGEQRKLAAEKLAKDIAAIDKETLDNTRKLQDEEIASYVSYYKEYGNYTEKRIAIEKEYNAKIERLQRERADAIKNGKDQSVLNRIDLDIAKATGDKGKDLVRLDYEQLKQNPNYSKAFENLQQTSSSTLKSLLSQLEAAKQTASEVLNPKDLKTYTSTIEGIMDELAERNPFQSLAEAKQELAESSKELAEAEEQLQKIRNGEKIVESIKKDDKTGKLIPVYLSEAKAIERVNNAKDKQIKANVKIQKSEQNAARAIGELVASIKGVGESIGGLSGQVIAIIGDISNVVLMSMHGFKDVSTTASVAIQTIEKASVVLAIISAAYQVAMAVINLFKEDDGVEKYNRAKEVYSSYVDILDKVIAKKKELYNLNTLEGDKALEESKKMQKEIAETAREMGKQYLDAGASRGFLGIKSSASHGVKMRKSISGKAWSQLEDVLGRTNFGKRMTGIFDLSVQELAKLKKEALLFYSELDADVRKYIDDILASEEKMKEFDEQRKAALLHTDFKGFKDSYADMLADLNSENKDFADNFENYMRNALIQSLLVEKYQGKIRKLYDSWANKTKSDHQLTKDEADELRKEQSDLTTEMLEDRKRLLADLGFKKQGTDQEAKVGHSISLTEETGGKIEGILNNMEMHVISLDENVADILIYMHDAISALNQIAENTGHCRKIDDLYELVMRIERDGLRTK